jgi:predicted nucleic acid-binding protein
MNAYWDTSGLIRAARLRKAPRGYTRSHSLAEFYAVMTGRGLTVETPEGKAQWVFSPADAVAAATATFANLEWSELQPGEVKSALSAAVVANVHGANIHDWLQARAAAACAADVVTLNARHFEPILGGLRLANVAEALAEAPDWA